MDGLDVYIIAGEPSGDRLGGALMQALEASGPVRFHGVGGLDMTAAGLSSAFDMSELTVMGLSEVLPKIPHLLRRIRETAADVIARRPHVLVTIDSPDFTLRVAARVRRALPDLRIVHYVAPSVWAWRPGRAAKMARYVDHVLCLLPFEPSYMHAAGMTADFVGHPVAGRPVPSPEEVAGLRAEWGLREGQTALLLAPGSRRGEVRRLAPVFTETVAALRRVIPDLAVVCPVAETVDAQVRAALAPVAPPVHLVPAHAGDARKRLAFAATDAALCASGTITLELAAAGTPMVAAYRTTWLTAQIVRRVIRVNSANLINLISGRNAVPEFLQEFCTPAALEAALLPLLNDPEAAEAQRRVSSEVMETMGRGGPPPAELAALSVRRFLAGDARLPDVKGPGMAPPGPRDRHIGKIG